MPLHRISSVNTNCKVLSTDGTICEIMSQTLGKISVVKSSVDESLTNKADVRNYSYRLKKFMGFLCNSTILWE
jgi:hypothetical protein